MTRLSLRLRIFLFFCLLAGASMVLAAGALALGWSRLEPAVPAGPFVTAFVIFGFFNTGVALAIWLLFDEHVAKPIERVSTDMRLRAHAGVDAAPGTDAARYLGDLAPAARALSQTMSSSMMETASHVARETERLRAESARLTALLSQMPVATLLLNHAGEIVLYDQQAAELLSRIAPPRLKAPLSDYFDLAELDEAQKTLSTPEQEAAFLLRDPENQHCFDARLKALGEEGYMVLVDVPSSGSTPIAARPLVFDFDLMQAPLRQEVAQTALRDLCFVAFDTETTGLSIAQDDIVQLGAVRVLNGRVVAGEVVNTFVNPGRPIPPASTRVHRITDEDVAGAPNIAIVGRAFHHFARDAVLVAHNAPFDIGLLRKYQPEIRLDWNHPVLDTVLLSAVVFGTTEDHSLDALCARLSITIPPDLRHSALGDAEATAQALIKLLPLLEGRGITTFGALIRETQRHGRLLEDMNG